MLGTPSVVIYFPFSLTALEPWEDILIIYTIPDNVLLTGFKAFDNGNNSLRLDFPPNLYNNKTKWIKIVITKPRSLVNLKGVPFYSKATETSVTFPLIVVKTT
jgi:hypothetical protein